MPQDHRREKKPPQAWPYQEEEQRELPPAKG
jgi:hypothetical protein